MERVVKEKKMKQSFNKLSIVLSIYTNYLH